MPYQNEVGYYITEVQDYINDNSRIFAALNPYMVEAVRKGDWGLAEGIRQAIERIGYLSAAYIIEKSKSHD